MNTDTKDFKWTDELVSDFILQECNKYDTWSKEGIELFLEKFKEQNCPSKPQPIKVISLTPEPSKDKADCYKHYELVLSGVIEADNVVNMIEKVLNFEPIEDVRMREDNLESLMRSAFNAGRDASKVQIPHYDYQYGDLKFRFKDFAEYKASLTDKQPEQPVYEKRPPLGLLPEIFWLEGRLKDVEAAITRYTEALKEIPSSWIEERYQLRNKIHNIQTHQIKYEYLQV